MASNYTIKLLRAATPGIQFLSVIRGQRGGFGTGWAVLAASDIPQASAQGEKQITLPANSLLFPILANLEKILTPTQPPPLPNSILCMIFLVFADLPPGSNFPEHSSLFFSVFYSGFPNVILGSGKWRPPPHSNPPFKSKFNCLWHHVWLLRATRQSGRDCGVQRASTNSLFFSLPFSQCLLLFHTCFPLVLNLPA